MSYQIQPFQEVMMKEFVSFSVQVVELDLGRSAKLLTLFFATDGSQKPATDILDDDDYKAWGSDDAYIVNWVAKKYNLTLVN